MNPRYLLGRKLGAAAACLALALGVLFTGARPATATPLPRVVPSFCNVHGDGYRCRVGPFDVGEGERQELLTGVAAPANSGYITAAHASLVDGLGKKIPHHMVHLHHAVWLNPYEEDTTCDSYDGGFPNYERFFATGKELTPAVMPNGYGYLWDPIAYEEETQSTPWWALVAHLDGMHGASDVYIRLDLDFVPVDEAQGYKGIQPIWLDVRNCNSDPVYQVPKDGGVDKETWTYKMPVGGRFVFLAGHLHDGGLHITLSDVSAGKQLFTSHAKYGMHSEPWFLTRMTSWHGSPGKRVDKGDRLKLTAVYDATHRWSDVMGIMFGALVPDN